MIIVLVFRTIELNFKHILGRAPDDYQEILHHTNLLDNVGYEAEIDSYIDSNEYQDAFGGKYSSVLPRAIKTQTGKKAAWI